MDFVIICTVHCQAVTEPVFRKCTAILLNQKQWMM